MNMSWGVTPVLCDEKTNTDELFAHAVERAEEQNLLQSGDKIIITAGIPLGISGTTNMLKVTTIE